jgi:ribonuclease R
MTKLIPGILKLFSSVKYGKNKRNVPIILFKPFNANLSSYFIHTREKSKKNLYVLISHHNHIEGKYPRGILECIIGPVGDYKSEIEYILCVNECSMYNPNFKLWLKVIKKHKNLKKKIANDLDYIKKLQDNKCLYNVMSIDPGGCKDIDDAFHFSKDGNIYEIGVHIADVSYYIDEFMENLIKNRCYTIYNIPFCGMNNNMIPDIYSEYICSLIKNENRRAISVIFKFDLDGNIISTILRNSIVKNIKNFTYKKVDHLLNEHIGKNIAEINCIQCINFFQKYIGEKLDSHTFIEKLMIMTNKTIGDIIIDKYQQPCIIRVHDEPIIDLNKLKKLDENIQDYVRIRNFKKAKYELGKDKYHYALGIKNYAHFTSPIRRYNDIIIHKIINNCINRTNKQITISQDDIERMNIIEKNIRKCDRMRRKCELIYQLEKEHLEDEIILDGVVIEITDNYLLVYFNKYKIEERLPYDNSKEMSINLYDEIKCRLIPFFKNEKFYNKIKIDIA